MVEDQELSELRLQGEDEVTMNDSRSKLSKATNKVIDNSSYVTRQKILNISPNNPYKIIFLQVDFRTTGKQNILNVSFPLAPSLQFLSLSEKYKIYYRTAEESSLKRFLGQVKYHSPAENRIILNNVNEDTKLWLKIVYAQ